MNQIVVANTKHDPGGNGGDEQLKPRVATRY
jgi:hypothetical protein